MLPKINFINSIQYNDTLGYLQQKTLTKKDIAKIDKKKSILEDTWKKTGKKLASDISKITGLKWHQKEINCYLILGKVSFSDPMTIGTDHKSIIDTIDAVTHELIHRILSEKENWAKIKKGWQELMKEYEEYNQVTKTHIVVHAIHSLILEKHFGKIRVKRQAAVVQKQPYLKSWEIVFSAGAETIVKKLKQGA